MISSALFAAAHGGHATQAAHATVAVEPWQLINLIGAPLVAIMFIGPVLDDLRSWIRSRREE